MNREELLQYLRNPQNLQELSYEALSNLVDQYPYCQNFRFLIAKKSQLDQRSDYDQKLKTAAIYLSSRSHLYQNLTHQAKQVEKIDDSQIEALFEKEDQTETIAIASSDIDIPDESSTPPTPVIKEETDQDTDLRPVEHRSAELRISESKDILTEKPMNPDLETKLEQDQSIYLDELLSVDPDVVEKKARISIVDEEVDIEAAVPEASETIEEIEEDEEEILEIPDININEVLDSTRTAVEIEQEASFVLPPSELPLNRTYNTNPLEEEELSFEELKASIPFEVTNEDLNEEDIAYISEPEPKSVFNSWFEQIKSGKGGNKEKKRRKKKKKKKGRNKEKGSLKKEETEKKEASEEQIVQNAEELLPVQKKVKVKKKKNKAEDKVKSKAKKDNKVKKKKGSSVKSFAQKSIVENETIASETLAKLLAEQGSPKKAIKMYERLSLIFPEKKTFFAERIEKLKKK